MSRCLLIGFAFLVVVVALPAPAQYLRGVNVSGAEFGQNHLPGVFGRDYTFSSELTYRYFAARNLGLIRLCLQWERLQPVLSGPLDAAYLGRIKTTIDWARADGNQVILDIHNFARYSMNENGALNTYIVDQSYNGVVRVTRGDLANLWVRLSNEFASDPVVYGYDLMNEPHDMSGWKDISQAVVTAIRANGDNKLILVPGDSWSSANRWQTVHGPYGWITDPANNFMYEAHQYFDYDESGSYKLSYDAELAANPGLASLGTTRVNHFLEWCRNNAVRGYLGEYGVPDSDARWWRVLDDFLNTLDAAQMHGTFWAAGEWWGAYGLSIQPTENFTVDRPQLGTLEAHLPPGSFTSVSAASNAGATYAPESILSGYGAGLAAGTEQARVLPWPVELAGTSVELTDSAGAVLEAPLIFVSPGQINYLIPAIAAAGRVNVAVKRQGQTVARGTYVLEPVAPTVFSANGAATGPAAATILRIQADGTQRYEYTSTYDTATRAWVPIPIDFGASGSDRLFLTLYATGVRHSTMGNATLKVGAATLSIQYLGAQPETPGLDQINAELPRSLIGSGQVAVRLTVDGKAANPVVVAFR